MWGFQMCHSCQSNHRKKSTEEIRHTRAKTDSIRLPKARPESSPLTIWFIKNTPHQHVYSPKEFRNLNVELLTHHTLSWKPSVEQMMTASPSLDELFQVSLLKKRNQDAVCLWIWPHATDKLTNWLRERAREREEEDSFCLAVYFLEQRTSHFSCTFIRDHKGYFD